VKVKISDASKAASIRMTYGAHRRAVPRATARSLLVSGGERSDHLARTGAEQDHDPKHQQRGNKVAPTRDPLLPDASPQNLGVMLDQSTRFPVGQ